jgi:NitT/TauT family transport system ATP-binding protein
MASTKTAIQVKNLSVIYNDVKIGLKALDNINFEVKEDEFVSIIGPSGCGKSTLFRVLGDILENGETEVRGDIKVLNKPAKQARIKRQIGIVFQKPTLLEWRNVYKNVALPLEIIGMDREEQEQRINKLLALVGLDKNAKFRPSQLSGGMQQRVSIARALAYDPEILLMDEPFGALDEIKRRQMNNELIKIWTKTKKTILFVTHSIEEAVYLSQQIIILSNQPGRIKKIVNIDLPYPREKVQNDTKFFNYIKNVRGYLEND